MARAFLKRYAPLSSIESVKMSVFVWRGAGQCVITVRWTFGEALLARINHHRSLRTADR